MTYFVNMSAMLSKVPILCTVRVPLCTSCCMKRYFKSMCFAFFDDPILVAMLLPLVESVWILICNLLVSIVSIRKFLMRSASVLLFQLSIVLILHLIVQQLLAFSIQNGLLLRGI